MSDPRFRGPSNVGGPGPTTAPQGRSGMQQSQDAAGGGSSKQAPHSAQPGTHQFKEQVSDVAESAKGLASEAGEKLKSAAEGQKNAGADFVSGFAGAVRRAAGEFDEHIPQAGQYIRRAADQIDSASDALRRRDLRELVGGIQDFARRQPTAFLGASALAGFALVRFFKSATTPQAAGNTKQSPSHVGNPSHAARTVRSPGSMTQGHGG